MTWLSGSFLSSSGWEKNGFVWTKGKSKITYDGCHWKLNDEKIIRYCEEIPPPDEGNSRQ